MRLTDYHTKYFAHELTKRCSSDSLEKLAGAVAGAQVDLADLRAAKEGAGEVPVLANTGVTHDNAEKILALADGVIVGTSLKVDGSTWNAVDPGRAARMADIVRAARGG